MDDHRIVFESTHLHPEFTQHHQIELNVLPHLGNRLVLEKRTDPCDHIGTVLVITRHIIGRMSLDTKRNPNQFIIEQVEPRSFRIETKYFLCSEPRDQIIQFFQGIDNLISMRDCLRRGILCCGKQIPLTISSGARHGYFIFRLK